MLKLLLTFFLLSGHLLLCSQELSYNHYTVHDGLAQMQIEDLLQDANGALWIATRGGVSRFNGYSFDSFEELAVKPGYCSEIVEDSYGNIIILGSDGLFIFDGSKFSFFKAPEKMRFNQMSYMTIDQDDQVWINNYNSEPLIFKDTIYQKFNDKYPNYKLDAVGQVFFHKPSKSMLTTINKKGVFKITRDSLIPILTSNNRPLIYTSRLKGSDISHVYIREYLGFASKVYSLGHDLDVTYHFNEESGEVKELKKPLPGQYLFTDRPSENLYVVGSDDKVSKKLIADLNAKFNTPGEAYFDEQDNIYLESDKGLIVINANKFEKLEPSKANNVWTINQTSNGDMLFGGYGSGIKIFDKYGNEKIPRLDDVSFCNKRSLSFEMLHTYMGSTKGLDNDIIFPTAEALVKYKKGEFNLFDYDRSCQTGMPSLYVFTDIENRRILSATCKGLRILNEEGVLLRMVKEGLFDHRCLLTINKDQEGRYWVGATGGIASYDFDAEEIKNYTQENGGFPYKGVVCTYIDFNGTLWAGSREGLTYFDKEEDKFKVIDGFDGVEVGSMITGEDSQLFISTAGALIEADLVSFYKDGKMLHRVYDKNNGLGVIGTGQNGFFKDSEGHIWCTSDTEVYRFNPKNLKANINTPIPKIVLVNENRVSNAQRESALEMARGVNNLSIEYESAGLNASNNLKYSYQLEGYNDDWSDYSKYNNCTYNNLGSGTYTFKVRNNISEQISSQEITIDIPFYKEPYFGGLAGIAAISFLLLSFLFGRNFRLAKRNNQLLKKHEQQLISEKKYLQELHRLEQENKVLLEEQNELLVFEKNELVALNQKLEKDIVGIKQRQTNTNDKLAIKTKGKINYIPSSELLYIHAEENGCRYFLKDNTSFWNDEKLKNWEAKLDPTRFVRIHRSTLVQKEYITKVSYDKLSLIDETELKIGRKYKQNL